MTERTSVAAMLADLRPLGARSVIASTLLGANGSSMPADRLVRAGELFGVADGAIRTALWRMVAAGELVLDGGRYALAGPLLERRERFATGPPRRLTWDHTWELAVVSAERRPAGERQAMREAAAALHLGELREGVWLRPANLDPARLPERQAVVAAQCLRVRTATLDNDPTTITRRLFDIDGWAEGARSLIAVLASSRDLPERLGPGDLAEGFRMSIAAVRHLAVDPLLPDELLPDGWPGDELRRRYTDFHVGFDQRIADWLGAPRPLVP